LLEDQKLTKKKKVEKIREKARELEERALLKEKDSNSLYGGSTNVGATTRGTTVNRAGSVEGALEANDMLVDAIKAKLAILDNLE
jgi:hypothetical protein